MSEHAREESRKAHYLSHKGVFNKVCAYCDFVYIKFHRDCPDCGCAEWNLPPEKTRRKGKGQHEKYLPTESQIADGCRKIQKGWEVTGRNDGVGSVMWKLPTSTQNPP